MRRLAVAVAVIATLGVGGVALAATTGDERINACVNNGDGSVRIVADAGTACSKGYHKLSWSQENPPAPAVATPPPATALKTYRNFGANATVEPNGKAQATVGCDAGDVATGGGFVALNSGLTVELSTMDPLSDGGNTGWVVIARNVSDAPLSLAATVVCLDITP